MTHRSTKPGDPVLTSETDLRRMKLMFGGFVAIMITLLIPAYFRAETAVVETICSLALPHDHVPWRREEAVVATKRRMRTRFACILAVISVASGAVLLAPKRSLMIGRRGCRE